MKCDLDRNNKSLSFHLHPVYKMSTKSSFPTFYAHALLLRQLIFRLRQKNLSFVPQIIFHLRNK
jgi:hypothetical protein